jgi:HAD superfamily hydrolase (TIGR01450 family)
VSIFAKKPQFGQTPLAGKELLLADLDGIVYRGARAVAHAAESIQRATEQLRVGYLTNNASRTDATVAKQLTELGLTVQPSDIVTSPQAAVMLLSETVPPGSTVFVVGGEGLTVELEKAGFQITRSADDHPAALVQGFAPEIGWRELAEASFALQDAPADEELPWIATNTDWTFPLERGVAPGNGTLVSALHIAVGRLPVFAGKPEKAIYETAFDRFGSRNALMIGDRLDTDIQGARTSGIESALVLTGIDRPKQLLAAPEHQRPEYILRDLRELHEPYPLTVIDKKATVTVGEASVRMEANRVVIVTPGDDPLNLLRAGCQAIWRSGLAIFALEVPEELYADVYSAR